MKYEMKNEEGQYEPKIKIQLFMEASGINTFAV
jgi:hypothetical protein